MARDGEAGVIVRADEDQRLLHENEQQEQRSTSWRAFPAHVWIRVAYWWYFAALGCLLPYVALYYQQLGFSGIEIGVLSTISPIAVAICAPAWGMLADGRGLHRTVLRWSLLIIALLALALTQTRNFWLIMLINAGIGAFAAPIPSLLDSYSVTIGAAQQRSYGQLRLWGSLGYSVVAWLVGWWMGGTVTRAFIIAYGMSALLGFGATFGLPQLAQRSKLPAWHGLKAVLRQPAMIVLLLTAFLATSSTSIVFNFFGIYVAALGGSAQLLGTATALSALCEMPVLLVGAYILSRFGSRRVLVMSVAIYCLRFAGYTVVPSATWIIPLQLLHGLTFGAFLMASVTLAYELVGSDYAATAQGLLSAMSYGFGAIVGSLLGGLLLDAIGILPLFRVATLLMIAALALLLTGLWIVRRRAAS